LKQSILLKHTASHPVEFHRYSQLPLELQLLILEECDAQTLFSLMRTCSTIRAQTKKLFWSHETPWYYASAAWIQSPGVPGATELCPEFAQQIEQVELDFWPVAVGYWRHDLLGTNNWTSDDDRLAQNVQAASVFWAKFQQVFPSAKRVALSHNAWRMLLLTIEDEFVALLRVSPPGLSVYICLSMQKDRNSSKAMSLYRLDANSQWELLQQPWTRHRVVPPRRNITGIVGRFQRIEWKSKELYNRDSALRQLRAEAYEKYHFGDKRQTPFVCPNPACREEFKKAGEYRYHMAALQPNTIYPPIDGGCRYPVGSSPPSFTEVEKRLYALEIEHKEAMKSIFKEKDLLLQEEWGKAKSEKRRLYKERFYAQLQADPAYQFNGHPRNTLIWMSLLQQWMALEKREETLA
jgi:hypothetical protein